MSEGLYNYEYSRLNKKYGSSELTADTVNQIASEADRMFQISRRTNQLADRGQISRFSAYNDMVVSAAATTYYREKLGAYNKQEADKKAALEAQQQAQIKQEAELKAQQEAQAKARAEQAKQISLLGQKDLAGVAREFGTTDLGAAIELQGQRKENIRKQQQAEKIESLGLKLTSRTQRGRRGTASSATGGRGFFERYFT
jgi:hypothetical protein